jgi:hypothetical protein
MIHLLPTENKREAVFVQVSIPYTKIWRLTSRATTWRSSCSFHSRAARAHPGADSCRPGEGCASPKAAMVRSTAALK